MITKVVGVENVFEFWEKVKEDSKPFGAVSPGSASMLLGYTRQNIYRIYTSEDDVRAWEFFETERQRAPTYVMVSYLDLVRHGVRQGRLKPGRSLAFGGDWEKLGEYLTV